MRAFIETLIQDVRYAARSLTLKPLFTLAVILTLGLALGANTIIFSFFNAAFLRPLPFPRQESLVRVYEAMPLAGFFNLNTSVPVIRDWREKNEVFERLSPLWKRRFVLSGGSEPLSISVTSVSTDFFQLMGVEPLLGRGLLPQDLEPGNHRVAVLSYGLWQRLFGGSEDVLQKKIRSQESGGTCSSLFRRNH